MTDVFKGIDALFGKIFPNLSLSDYFLTIYFQLHIFPGMPLCVFWCHVTGGVQCQFEHFTDIKCSAKYNDTYEDTMIKIITLCADPKN